MRKPYTVIAYRDGDYSVETHIVHVEAEDKNYAFHEAKKLIKSWGENVHHLTEIATFEGHLS